MKRIVLIGLLLIGVGSVSYAQVDDIYANGTDQRGTQPVDTGHNSYDRAAGQGGGDSYAPDNYQSYNNPDDYVDYDDDSYSSRINRFDNSFYNMGYYSTFYNPFWYDRYWVDPYWGYNPWWGPSFTFSFGYGPFWTSYWGWNTWWGYPGFYSCWSYPLYAGGWWGHCYNGYWNRVYAGADGYRHYNHATAYGPRQNSIGHRVSNHTVGGNGFRTAQNQIGLRHAPLAYANPRGMRGNGSNYRNGYGGNAAQRGNAGGNRGYNGAGRGYNQAGRNGGQRGGGFRNFFNGGGNRGYNEGAAHGGGGRAFNGGGNRGQAQQGGGRSLFGGGNRGGQAPQGGGRMFNGGGGGRSFGGGGGSHSFGGGGGHASGGGGGGRSGGGGGHSGGGGRR